MHTSEETREYLATVPDKFEFVFTPKHASWLNIIESFFSKMWRNVLRGIRVDSINELKERISQYINQINEKPVLFTWRYNLTMSHYQMKTSSLDHIKPNTLFAAKSMTANGVTV